MTVNGADPTFPVLHGRPPTGWINDPNGCGRIDGVWHVFYQLNPAAPTHGLIHWGHMSSPDLVRWTTEPVALAPRADGPDSAGCWSGSLVDDAGVPTLVYTGVVDTSLHSSVMLARSDRDLRTFTRDEPPAAGMPADPSFTDVRDPYVFTVDGHRFAVQGAGRDGEGRVLVYDCDDLTRWSELGTLLSADHPVVADVAGADTWECPNLIKVGDDWVLIVSLLIRDPDRPNHVVWILGDLTVDDHGPAFAPRAAGRLDEGPAFYAPQVGTSAGRAVLWGWAWELARTAQQVSDVGWAGVLTFPRELGVRDGRLVARPVPELDQLRAGPAPLDRLPRAFEVVCARHPDPPTDLRLELDGNPVWTEPLPVHRIFVDGSLIEVFTGDGRTFTTRAYPSRDPAWRLTGDLTDVTVHRLAMHRAVR